MRLYWLPISGLVSSVVMYCMYYYFLRLYELSQMELFKNVAQDSFTESNNNIVYIR